MKKNIFKTSFLFLFSALILNSCQDKCFYYEDSIEYHEILGDVSDVKNSFAVKTDFAIKKPGTIYTYNQYLLVAEKNEGIHILNNANPASPIPLKFIQLKGNSSFVVANNILLAENGADLLSINISDLNNITLENRVEGVNNDVLRGNNKLVIGYNEVKIRKKVECNGSFRERNNMMADAISSPAINVNAGKGGSMAKFTVLGNYLYIAHSSKLLPLNISNPSSPVKKLSISFTEGNVETIFPYKNFLYFGTSSGVLVYDCASNPEVPKYRNTLRHAIGCDPVIVSDDICFSTIRNGTACRNNNTVNELNIYDVKNVSMPIQLRNVPMDNPYGLGIKNDVLFICQANKGLTVLNWNAANKNVTLKHNYNDIHAYDVIVNGNTLIVTAENGLFQFDCTDTDNIRYLSTLVNF